jgi:pyridinium-3,5-biscarboxylic acid mononucleotide sulfurtransferase
LTHPEHNLQQSAITKLSLVSDWFLNFRSALVALSAGVDSSVLASVARRTLGKENSLAVTSVSPAFSSSELEYARTIAKEIDIELKVVYQDDLSSPDYVANGVNRCYFCRSNLASSIRHVAESRKIEVCVDGTHLDDLKSPRPGIKALREAGFRAPLAELRFSKQDVREIARILNLSNSERPSEACLSSRVAYGQTIDFHILRRIEKAEVIVRNLTGAKIVRVRTINQDASVEVDKHSLRITYEKQSEITSALKNLGFGDVRIDPEGYTSGKMLQMYVKNEVE